MIKKLLLLLAASGIAAVNGENHFQAGLPWFYFKTKNTHLHIFWRALEWYMLVYFTLNWNIFRSFLIFYGHLVVSWYIYPRFGILCEEKSSNPAFKFIATTEAGV
jgi:hypothetical protein